ncbi:MAG TPA: response regulator [Anaerolineae bacterium]|nr:response regulator [Anaerolineae bacterium]
MAHTILVVEDNPNIRRFIRTTLELEGYQVQAVPTLQEGLASARRAQPDLILLDLALPDGTGWDFLEAMQTRPETRTVRVAMLTASADHGMAARALAAGAVAFITKPIAAGELVAHVRQALAAHRAAPKRSD